jgi:hypothetical protein
MPRPVGVIVAPEMVPGPDTIENVKAPAEFDAAVTVKGAPQGKVPFGFVSVMVGRIGPVSTFNVSLAESTLPFEQ